MIKVAMMKLPYLTPCSTESPTRLEADVQQDVGVSLRSLFREAAVRSCQRNTVRPVIGKRSVGFVICFCGTGPKFGWYRGVL